jgi:hypothetical protein
VYRSEFEKLEKALAKEKKRRKEAKLASALSLGSYPGH